MSFKIRPVGVTILAVLEIISGIVGIVGGIFFATIAGLLDIDFLGAISGIVAAILVAIGIASFVMAWGLLEGKPWAWTFTLILTIISVVFELAGANIVGLIIDAIVLYYLFRPHVKAFFGKSDMVL
jgi:hypothetical protein